MNRKDQHKVWQAGFQIIRRDEHAKKIKILTIRNDLKDRQKSEVKPMQLSWQTLEDGFDSKAAMNRKADELTTMNLIIED